MNKVPMAEIIAGFGALCPLLSESRRSTLVVFADGRKLPDSRQVQTLVAAIARHLALDLIALRQRCGQKVFGRNYLPLPMAPGLCLVPVVLGRGSYRLGYVNYGLVTALVPGDKGCSLILTQGELACAESAATIRARLLRAQLLIQEITGPEQSLSARQLAVLKALLD